MMHKLIAGVVLSVIVGAIMAVSDRRLLRRHSSARVAAKLSRSSMLWSLAFFLIGPLLLVARETGHLALTYLWDAAMGGLPLLEVAALLTWRARREEAGLVLVDLGRHPLPNKLFAIPIVVLLWITGKWMIQFPLEWNTTLTFIGLISLVITIVGVAFTRLQICNGGILHYTKFTSWGDIAGYSVTEDGSLVTFERREISSMKVNEIRCRVPLEHRQAFFYAVKSRGIPELEDVAARPLLNHV